MIPYTDTDRTPTPSSRLYRTIWRWHFYAGLIVAPVLLVLAVTGTIYLFGDAINDRLYPEQRFVTRHRATVPVSAMIRSASRAYPGSVSRIDLPDSADRSATVFVAPPSGEPVQVSVDPGTGRVLGHIVYDRTLVGFADTMHGSLTMGTLGEHVVELAACWAMALIATGLVLWWPRGRSAGVFRPRPRARGRVFWRDVHAVTGIWAIVLVAFMLSTGLPWAAIEGAVIQRVGAAAGVGYPAAHFTQGAPESVPMKQALGSAPWTLEPMPMPMSGDASAHAGHAGHVQPGTAGDAAAILGIDRAVAVLRDHGLAGGYRLFLPVGPRGVYTAYTYPHRPEGQRTLYIDRWRGTLIREVDFADYGWVGKAVEIGVQLHMGNYFGTANRLVMLLPCLAIVALVTSGIAMWWKRRPTGAFGAPPRTRGGPIGIVVAVSVVAAIAMPLFGLSLIVVLALDRVVSVVARGMSMVGGDGIEPPTRSV